jgi:hypothetical protein
MHRSIVALLAFAPLAAAQSTPSTWVVDDDGPADFVHLSKAVQQAADGDVILVRSGGYEGPVRIEGKSLTIQAEGDVTVFTLWPGGSPLEVRDLQAGQSVQLRGLKAWLLPGDPSYPPAIELEDNAGPVWIEDCELDGTLNPEFCGTQVGATRCASVTLARCRLLAPVSSKFFSTGFNPWRGVEAVDSRLFLYGCDVFGGHGIDSNATTFPVSLPGTASPAIALYGSTLFASGCTLAGGDGGSDVAALCAAGGDGAPALVLDASASAAGSTAFLLDTTLQGGVGGLGGCGHPDGLDAAPLQVVAGVAAPVPGAAASFYADSPVDAGAGGSVHLSGQPGDVAFVLVSASPSVAIPVPGLLGALQVPGAGSIVVAFGALPGSGELDLSVAMPALPAPAESARLFGQALFVGPGGVSDGGVSMLLITDPAL